MWANAAHAQMEPGLHASWRSCGVRPASFVTFSKCDSRILCVNSVEDSFVANLGLGDEADFAA